MKIALVNYRYFISGGPERYLFNIKEILEQNGHEVVPFSVQHAKNVKSEYEHYFLSLIGSGNEIYFSDYNKKSIKDSIKGFARMTYSFEAKRVFKKFLEATKPDLVYILYYQSKISCSIVDVAYSMKIPVVQRISDYSLLSPCSMLYRYNENTLCEYCLQGSKLNAVKHKCIYNSAVYSLIKVFAIKIQNIVNVKKKIEAFVFPSKFTLDKFIDGGFPKEKLHHIPTLFNTNTIDKNIPISYENFALYVGRVDPDKGIKTMIDAFIDTDYNLKIIGFSSKNYIVDIEEYLNGKKHNIELLGKMDFEQIQEYLAKCLFTVIPSEWYDNLPNTLLESFAFSKCVVTTNIGSLSENVINNETGLLFDYKNSKSLFEKIDRLFKNQNIAIQLGQKANLSILDKFNDTNHYKTLITLFEKTLNTNNK